MRSGKDTIADYLVREHVHYARFGFADALKGEVAFGLSCSSRALDQEPLRSQIRPVLQAWGTEFRRGQDPDYWVKKAAEKIDSWRRVTRTALVFADVRFRNEIGMLRSRGFVIVKVDMSIDDVVDYCDAPREETLARLQHASEQEWRAAEFDVVIPSVRGNIQGLYDAIDKVVWGDASHA